MKRTLISSLILLLIVLTAGLLIGPAGFDMNIDLITSIRAPRVVTAAFAGAATAAAGALSQSLFRNPLATPSIIGTEAGASFALALATIMAASGYADIDLSNPVFFTSLGAGIATIASLALIRPNQDSHSNGNEGLPRLLLGGFALNAMLAAGTALCVSMLMERGDGMNLYHWLMGSFSSRTWNHATGIATGYFLCAIVAVRTAPTLDALSLGDDASRSIGINVPVTRIQVLLLIAVLVGSSLSCGGALPFVGLIAPHLARVMTRPHFKSIFPVASVFGAILAVTADLVARTARAPIDMDVGILTTIIGAPYFLWLLWREERA